MLSSSQEPVKRLRGRWQLQGFLLKMLLSRAVLKKAAQSLELEPRNGAANNFCIMIPAFGRSRATKAEEEQPI